jgi:hypothetical protein
MRFNRLAILLITIIVLTTLIVLVVQRYGDVCPIPLDPTVPVDADFDEQGVEDQDRPEFNDFSWRVFVALNWPAKRGERGTADVSKAFGSKADQVVWESWPSVDHLFPKDPIITPPIRWECLNEVDHVSILDGDGKVTWYKAPATAQQGNLSPCGLRLLGDLNQSGVSATDVISGKVVLPSPPLITQNKTYVRYEIRINRVAYDFVRCNEYFLGKTLSVLPPLPDGGGLAPSEFPVGSINVKAAWMELPADERIRERFYHVPAKVLDWNLDGNARWQEREMGLVGLHIVHKTPKRRNWIWSTFEQVDNVTPGPGACAASFSSLPGRIPDPIHSGKPLPDLTVPVQVIRSTNIDDQTKIINDRYHKYPQINNSVWRYYQLVATQWPKKPGDQDPKPGNFFPAPPVANAVIETSKDLRNASCLTCHRSSDIFQFVFYPQMRAYLK